MRPTEVNRLLDTYGVAGAGPRTLLAGPPEEVVTSDFSARHEPRRRRSSRSTGLNECVETGPSGAGRLSAPDSRCVSGPPPRFAAAADRASFVSGPCRAPVS
ncbi:hypothetical protein [Streptomyces sp. PTD5-9]|uniref:hypothetical protein n=1 Tax=Streptomyces sp. PTD5-9 TaxID=3120150 RepID=UPI003008AB70